ncbi:MAG: FecR domain-containing protein [Dysgonamonadaceae bacterium]
MREDKIKITPRWSKSKEDIWNETFAGLVDDSPLPMPTTKKMSPLWKYVGSVAAVLLLFILPISFFYTVTKISAPGEHLAVVLPDGSQAVLNADSRLSYKPYWWFASRKVELAGEAYFRVTHGRRFSVVSEHNEVNVLGTSFNIFSRAEKYVVTCLTGKVRVVSGNRSAVLTPDMLLTKNGGMIVVERNTNGKQSIGWTENRFVFVGVPLADVVAEVERQYNIHIRANAALNYTFSGNFARAEKPDEVLDIIGKPFGIKFSYTNR